MRWPFVTLREHQVIVELWRQRCEDVSRERDFYRSAWLERLGLKFSIPKSAEVTAINPSAPVTIPSELEQRKTFQLDRSGWTKTDDEDFYQQYWVKPNLEKGMPAEELEYWYYQRFGNAAPMGVFLDQFVPI